MLEGRLLEYWPSKRLVAFESGACGSSSVVILLGGLTDGLVPTPYTKVLDERLKEAGHALVQPILRTSYCQFGTGTLQQDAEDLTHLLSFIGDDPNRTVNGPVQVAMIGHSTGCQMICTFTRDAPEHLRAMVKVVALQAPVSDREGLVMEMEDHHLKSICEAAQKAVDAGEPKKIVHTLWGRAPVMARRVLDLFVKNGSDDFFSSDFTDAELVAKLGHLASFKTLFAISLDDEYVPDMVYPGLAQRFQAAVPGSELLEIENGNHSLSMPDDGGEQFVEAFIELLPEPSGPKGGEGENEKRLGEKKGSSREESTLSAWAHSLARTLTSGGSHAPSVVRPVEEKNSSAAISSDLQLEEA
mmetsp:Transcript_22399/g.43932  ORF Transcript_22399/g.43932 Transcript_22399/m.43932 type:complete len:357 (+) Transcript_22399:325-1395(+)|eukprot:CAMPEP_0171501300 /NCGR_PEP_ID=MMETSP0958-20121227/9477_1 /TAXON_ID=87120 /ORGANISM="Aurantiochytrium limacinum, Strain ATCCMYA-1381" /LENGTH=356 /DNA_ID=CAMNT_0012036091 /DNA_START=251 /DNA_END=1321 /DNA_ORIENTATION=+